MKNTIGHCHQTNSQSSVYSSCTRSDDLDSDDERFDLIVLRHAHPEEHHLQPHRGPCIRRNHLPPFFPLGFHDSSCTARRCGPAIPHAIYIGHETRQLPFHVFRCERFNSEVCDAHPESRLDGLARQHIARPHLPEHFSLAPVLVTGC